MAAEATVDSLLDDLKQLLASHGDLIASARGELELLACGLEPLAAFLRDSSHCRGSERDLDELVSKIRDLAYEVEDAVDAFVSSTSVHKARGFIATAFAIDDYPARFREVARKVDAVRTQVDEDYQKKMLTVDDGTLNGFDKKQVPISEEDNLVGLASESKSVIHSLTAGSSDLEAISIIGVPGLRKTTLAKKIFKDLEIEYEFFIRVWVCVSQEYIRKEIFLTILRNVTNTTGEIERLTEIELAEELARKLRPYKYLIVLDDVWTTQAWDDIKVAFPDNKKGSRILITSRNEFVTSNDNPKYSPHPLNLLTFEESWELLQRKVFGKEMCHSDYHELAKPGKRIAERSQGLPLTIVLIAGVLFDKGNRVEEWERVAESDMSCEEVAELSYNQLPYYLKACFLYLAVFPEDFEIPLSRLIRLWIAEGFIKKNTEKEESLEVSAARYLQDLVDRNLVIVEKRKWNGQIRTCRVHDLLYFFCKKKAEDENFLKEVKGQLPVASLASSRRLSVHFNVMNYISSRPSGYRVRSFLCFSLERVILSREEVLLAVHGAFKVLKVLDIYTIKLPLFPPDLVQLVHLRFLSLFCDSKLIPKTISSLWNMQSLIIGTSSSTLELQGEVLGKMIQLRHVNTNASTSLSNPPPLDGNAENLQTLSAISPESCTKDLMMKTPNLQKLGIRGQLAVLSGEKFENIGKLQYLENLKLFNDEFLNGSLYDRKPFVLPTANMFPPKLKKLTLSDTYLSWDLIYTIAMLENLEVLKLKDYAFQGENWGKMDLGFPQLKVLHIERTDMVTWQASAHQFPLLQCVFLRNCSYLKILPSDMADICTFHTLELYSVTPEACQCAKDIADQKKKQEGKDRKQLNLSIYPPDHWPKQ